mmetsp:Transcript_8691/g.25004  ORF Transcript_8691/g.25004 Transcript_8691/m.25004 type:complete len:216 (+) Transcript_8691:1655-2302(+)
MSNMSAPHPPEPQAAARPSVRLFSTLWRGKSRKQSSTRAASRRQGSTQFSYLEPLQQTPDEMQVSEGGLLGLPVNEQKTYIFSHAFQMWDQAWPCHDLCPATAGSGACQCSSSCRGPFRTVPAGGGVCGGEEERSASSALCSVQGEPRARQPSTVRLPGRHSPYPAAYFAPRVRGRDLACCNFMGFRRAIVSRSWFAECRVAQHSHQSRTYSDPT